MSEEHWDANRCNDRAGFLFSHDCPYPPVNECRQCQRPVCDSHTRYNEASEPVCVTCSKSVVSAKPTQRRPGDARPYYDSDPYFYGYTHYYGYGHYGRGYWGHNSYHSATSGDDLNFNAGDSEVLAEADDDATFESDMSES